MMPSLVLGVVLALAGVGAFLDLRERRLPNWLCAALAVAGGSSVAYLEGIAALPWALLHAVLALVVGMVLFRLRMIGGGDAKFYAAAACAVPIERALPLLGWTSFAGLLLILVMAFGRRIMRTAPAGQHLLRGWEVPYGVAIAAGLFLTVLLAARP